jgi:hypothetical protein
LQKKEKKTKKKEKLAKKRRRGKTLSITVLIHNVLCVGEQ